MAYFDQDGKIYIIDRLKDLIKAKGMQVSPAELEAAILLNEKVTDVAVVGAEAALLAAVPELVGGPLQAESTGPCSPAPEPEPPSAPAVGNMPGCHKQLWALVHLWPV